MRYNRSKLILFILMLLSTNVYAQLTDQERRDLANAVVNDYYMDGVDGVRIYDTSKNWVAVVFQINTSGMAPQDRGDVAKMFARNALYEFLEGAKNTSTTVYTSHVEHSENTKKSLSDMIANDDSAISQKKNSERQRVHEENLDKKIISKAISNLKYIQSLKNFKGPYGESIRCDYIVLKKSTAKNKQ